MTLGDTAVPPNAAAGVGCLALAGGAPAEALEDFVTGAEAFVTATDGAGGTGAADVGGRAVGTGARACGIAVAVCA